MPLDQQANALSVALGWPVAASVSHTVPLQAPVRTLRLFESGMFDVPRWIVFFAVLHAGCDLVERRFYPRLTSLEEAETVVAERPDTDRRSNRQLLDPLADDLDPGQDVTMGTLNDRPLRYVLPVADFRGNGREAAHFNDAP